MNHTMNRAVLAVVAAAVSTLPVAAFAQEGEVKLAMLPPPGPTMELAYAEGEAGTLYPDGTVLPDTAYVCVPEDGGLAVFRRADGALLVVEQGACAGGEEPLESDPIDLKFGGSAEAMAMKSSSGSGGASGGGGAGSPALPKWAVVASSGPDAATYPVATEIEEGVRLCLREGSRVVLVGPTGERRLSGPGCFAAEDAPRVVAYAYPAAPAPAARPRTRGGATRGASPSYMLVIRGSPRSLAFYPVGSRVPGFGRICLPRDAGFLTFQREAGGLLTYGDGGCNRVIAEPKPGEGTEGAGSGP